MSERGSKSFAVKQRYFSVDYGDDIFCTDCGTIFSICHFSSDESQWDCTVICPVKCSPYVT